MCLSADALAGDHLATLVGLSSVSATAAREILARANAAKAFAKTERKGSIAVVESPTWEPAPST